MWSSYMGKCPLIWPLAFTYEVIRSFPKQNLGDLEQFWKDFYTGNLCTTFNPPKTQGNKSRGDRPAGL